MKQKNYYNCQTFRFKQFARKAYSAFASIGKSVSIGVIAGCTLTMMSGSAVAQDGQKPVKILEKELEEIQVTASLAESPLEEITKSLIVISQDEIQRAPIQSINDLLTHIASVDIIQRGAHGVQADLSIRGGSLDQVAVLINGINLSNAQTGHYSLDIPINLSDIKRIEILHGPSALTYGSSAFSGGINIITKDAVDEKLIAKMEMGMHKLKNIETRGAIKTGKVVNSLSANYRSSDGHVANSDYEIYNMLWQSDLKIEKDNSLKLLLGYNDKKYGANTFYSAKYPNQYEETSTYMGAIKGEFGSKLKFKPSIYWTRHHDQFDLIRGTTSGRNIHRGDTYGANLAITYTNILGKTSLASEIRKDEMMSTKLGFPMVKPHRKYTMYDDRTNTTGGLEHVVTIDKFILDAGFLLSNNSIESGKVYFLPSASASYTYNQHLKITTAWSKSNRVPTFTDLHYTTETHTANEKLKPEQSESWELGFKYSNSFLSAYATGYLSWGRNIIDWVKDSPDTPTWSSWNHSKIDTKGIEMGVKLNLNNLTTIFRRNTYFKIDYSHINQDLDNDNMISRYSLNYMKNKFTAEFNHPISENLSITWNFRLQDRAGKFIKYENLEPNKSVKYPAYNILDTRINYSVKDITLHLNLNNIYNTKHYDIENIQQQGFNLTAGIVYIIK